MGEFTEIRLRSRVPDEAIAPMAGKILTDNEYDLLVHGPTAAWMPTPEGPRLLLKYLPRAFSAERMASFYDVLHELKSYETTNRGLASGTERRAKKLRDDAGNEVDSSWTYSQPVASAIIGAFDPLPPKQYCRLTAFTGRENEKFASLFPLFQDIGALFAEHVPDRFEAQMAQVRQTVEDWVVPGTPFTTITVNNTYPTGVHTDKGDLDEGFSTLAVLRRGAYTGGRLVFPQWRVAVDMQDGDLLLMDAHQWHGNTAMTLLDPPCWMCDSAAVEELLVQPGWASRATWRPMCAKHAGEIRHNFPVEEVRPIVPAERISIVSYYRTKMKDCGTAEEEVAKAAAWGERRAAINVQAVEEMAAESATV